MIETTGFPDFQKAASEADVVFNFTSAANPPLIQAIIAGLKERSEKTKKRPYFFHVSGATSILDPTPFEQSKVISVGALVSSLPCISLIREQDTDEAKLRAIPLSNFTHASDVEYVFSLPFALLCFLTFYPESKAQTRQGIFGPIYFLFRWYMDKLRLLLDGRTALGGVDSCSLIFWREEKWRTLEMVHIAGIRFVRSR